VAAGIALAGTIAPAGGARDVAANARAIGKLRGLWRALELDI